MDDTTADRILVGLGAAAAASGCALHAWAFGTGVLPVDDAYITLENARAMWAPSVAWPGVPPLSGATSGWHTALVAAALAAWEGPTASYAAGAVAVILYAAGLVRLALNLGVDRRLVLVLAAVGALAGDLPHQLFNGLETGLALAAVAWTFALWSAERTPGRDVGLGALCGQLAWVRPELALLGAAVVGSELAERSDRRQVARRVVLPAALGAAPWAALYALQTGQPLPGTASAKAHWFAEYCLPLSTRLERAARAVGGFGAEVGLPLVGLALAAGSRRGWVGLAFLAAFVAATAWIMPGGLHHYHHRYLYVAIPIAAVGLASAAARASLPVAGLAAALLAGQLALTAPRAVAHHRGARGFTERQLAPVAALLHQLPADAVVLVHDAGYLGYAGDRRLVDLVGLKTPLAAAAHAELTGPSCKARRPEAIARIAAATRPTHGVFLREWDKRYGIRAALQRAGWGTSTISPEGWKYVVVALALAANAPALQPVLPALTHL